MQVIAIVGGMGSGKTLLMTYLAYQDFLKKRSVFSNYGLSFKHDKFNKEFLMNYTDGEGLNSCTICADEFHIFMDSRNHALKSNKLISYMINQCRKRSVDFMFTTQSIDQVDVRLRRACTLFAFPEMYVDGVRWMSTDKVPKKAKVSLLVKYVFRAGGSMVKHYHNMESVFKLYNTDEIVDFE